MLSEGLIQKRGPGDGDITVIQGKNMLGRENRCNKSLYLFDMDHFKVFVELVTTLLPFYVLVFWPRDMWGSQLPNPGSTHTPCSGR